MNITRTIHSQCDTANVFLLDNRKMSLRRVNNRCESANRLEESWEKAGESAVISLLVLLPVNGRYILDLAR